MSTQSSNVTSGFIDLATYDSLEKYMYGGDDAYAYLVRETVKSTWFTQVPVVLTKATGTPGFGQEWSVNVSHAADYLLHTWLRVTTPVVTPLGTSAIGWTRNLMHNLVEECSISFNDLTAARFDSYHLDFWSNFTVPEGKRVAYDNMIGNVDTLIQPASDGTSSTKATIPAATLNLPLPFFYSRDHGVALPTAALPYNDIRINFKFRPLASLLYSVACDDTTGVIAADTIADNASPVAGTDFTAADLTGVQVWANYAIVSSDERASMGCGERDILIEQVQTAPRQVVSSANLSPTIDIRFSHAVKALFFAVRNTTQASIWSNYGTHRAAEASGSASNLMDFEPSASLDPISTFTLLYESNHRLSAMGADYFSLIQPWFHGVSTTANTGYHMYSYSLDLCSVDPMGSTNFGRLTHVSVQPVLVAAALLNADSSTYELIVTAVNHTYITVGGGAMGFPVL